MTISDWAISRRVGSLAAGVTLATTALYLFLYTPLKRLTPLATLVGAVPGALPPLTGWVAAGGELGPGGWILFAIVFLWQVPHTLAIARLYEEDYARAGIRVCPSSTQREKAPSARSSWLPGALGRRAPANPRGLTGSLYFFGALALGSAFLAADRARPRPVARVARRVVLASILLLPLLFALMAFDTLDERPARDDGAPRVSHPIGPVPVAARVSLLPGLWSDRDRVRARRRSLPERVDHPLAPDAGALRRESPRAFTAGWPASSWRLVRRLTL